MGKKSVVVGIFLLVAFFAVSLIAFAEEEKEKPKFGFNMDFNIGLSSYENSNHQQVTFQKFSFFPEFSYGKWGLGLDLTFEFDGNFKLRDLDNDGKPDTWSTFTDYLYKIYYVRYGFKGDPLYARIGAFDSYTLGHGLIMSGFSNVLFYPQIHHLGLNLDIDGSIFNMPIIGMESVVRDVLDWDIIGLRVYVRPLTSLSTPIIKDLKVGATFVTDRDPQEITDTADPNYEKYGSPKDNPNSTPVSEFGLDTELPIFQKGKMSLITYADWAKIAGKGSGSLIGATFQYSWFKLIGQMRFFGKEFVMSYFDSFYEVERSTKYNSLNAYDQFYAGYLVGTDLSLFNLLTFTFYWSDGFNDSEGPRIQTRIATVKNAIPKFDITFSYDKKDISSFADTFSTANSLMELEFAYKVSPIASIVFIYQRTYTPSGNESDQTLIETRFSF